MAQTFLICESTCDSTNVSPLIHDRKSSPAFWHYPRDSTISQSRAISSQRPANAYETVENRRVKLISFILVTNQTSAIGRKSNIAPSGGASNAAQHLDAVPMSTPVHIVAKNMKKVRSYPMFLNSYIDQSVTENANQEECLVPIRIDMELEGTFSLFFLKYFCFVFRA